MHFSIYPPDAVAWAKIDSIGIWTCAYKHHLEPKKSEIYGLLWPQNFPLVMKFTVPYSVSNSFAPIIFNIHSESEASDRPCLEAGSIPSFQIEGIGFTSQHLH